MPPAPPIFSTTTGWCSWMLRPSETMRAMASVDPPAAKGAIIVKGRTGHSCGLDWELAGVAIEVAIMAATTSPPKAPKAAAQAFRIRRDVMLSPLLEIDIRCLASAAARLTFRSLFDLLGHPSREDAPERVPAAPSALKETFHADRQSRRRPARRDQGLAPGHSRPSGAAVRCASHRGGCGRK